MLTDDEHNEAYINAINLLTEKLSDTLLEEYSKLPEDLQKSLVLIKSTQLLLANVLCQIAMDKDELNDITNEQGMDIKELVHVCAESGFPEKFQSKRH